MTQDPKRPSGAQKRLWIIISAALLVEVLMLVQYQFTRRQLDGVLRKQAEMAIFAKSNLVRNTLLRAEISMQEHLWDIQEDLAVPDSMYDAARRLIHSNPFVSGGCLAFIPDYYPQEGRLFEPYATWQDGKIVVRQLATPEHDYTRNPDFLFALERNDGIWSDPYPYQLDSNKAVQLTTYSYPLTDAHGKVVAVAGLDVNLTWLGDTLNINPHFPSSFALILSPEGDLIAGPPEAHAKSGDIGQVLDLLREHRAEKPPGGQVGFLKFRSRDTRERVYVCSTSLRHAPYWEIVQVNYHGEVFAPAYKVMLLNLLLVVAGLLILFFIIHHFARGERRLNEARLEQVRIGSELQVAGDIQMAMLPKTFPPFPDRKDIDIYGSLTPAREVGGDIFDFFIRDEKLFFCIGDVSGKGVPAAMVMSALHGLFRMEAARDNNPARILRILNGELCRNNEKSLFVTFFLGILDLPTGRLRYCNAGHDKPVLVTDRAEKMAVEANLPIGVFPDHEYDMQECQLPERALLFLYTDGLTEAKNAQREQFGFQRVMEVFDAQTDTSATTLVQEMENAVHAFVGAAEQSDDLTMLAVRYTRCPGECILDETLTLPCDTARIPELGDFIKSVSGRLGLKAHDAAKVRLAVEEIVVNVMTYAFPDGAEGEVNVTARSDRHSLRFIIRDRGIAFDPTEVAPADTTVPAEERVPGGLGILLARELADSVNYERIDGENILTLNKSLHN